MGLFLQDKTNDTQWAVWKVEESLEALLALLPDARRVCCEQELLQFASERRKIEWLSVRVLLYFMLKEDKQIGYSSDTKGYVAVILNPKTPVGIDIEQYGKRVHKVFDRFIRPDEQVEAYQGDTTWGGLLHWSAKETVFKCMKNADADLRKLCLSHFIPQKEGTFQVREYATEGQSLFSVGYRICEDFVLTWTSC